MLKVGLSGKIASGKSEVECMLQKLGYLVYDLDKLSSVIFSKKEQEILAEFNTIDRKEVAQIIFNDLEKKEKLENIIYPELKNEILNLFEKNKNEKMIFVSGALLFKSGFYKLFDKNIFISATDEIRLNRLMKRNNLTKENALFRLNMQDESDLADFIIENNSDVKTLENKVKQIISSL